MRNVIGVFVLLAVGIMALSFKADKPSDLEKMMKEMLNYIRLERKQVESNQPAFAFTIKIKALKNAKVHGKKPTTEHQMYIDDFFERLNQYQQTKDSTERRAAFNLMVNSCVNCHRHECPGPVQTIQKSLF